ncbi:MAG: Hsp70 family protein, partial [Desulfosalsimonadaceae bacterium]|nr:Hsp70 family protein [Desulfosalsimonadaceae bacterium]
SAPNDQAPEQAPQIRILDIPQIVGNGVVENRNILPSFIFQPAAHEISDGRIALPWDEANTRIVGEYARQRGAEVPQRLISSSKSWLSNQSIDRNQPVLPWDGPDDIPKLSPVESSALILQHIRDAWNHQMASGDDRLNIEHQEILLTVPASFDAVARELTVKAARQAGLTHVTLLEEPQAAFYSWIESSKDLWRKNVKKGDLVLVCDVGGGTTDFSLIRVTEQDGDLVLERIAVGDHLLVGGDNMDLALAYGIARKMSEAGTRLDAWQMRGLVHSCRNAKEILLSDPNTREYPITILGRGSRLIGGTLTSSLNRNEIERIILDGFFPACESTSMPVKPPRVGLQEAGLSYESDPGVSRHLAKFLTQQKKDAAEPIPLPTAVLFNGGVMKSESVRQQVLSILNGWGGAEPLRELHSHDFDLSVARGAAYYGLARKGRGVRIRGGLAKSYYIGIAASMPAVPGLPAPVKALCVAGFGMEEGTDINLTGKEFALVVGEPVRFDFLGSSVRRQDTAGEIVEDWQEEIDEIAAIETTLDGEYGKVVRVTIEIKATEIGTLELWCVSVEDGHKWKLEFNIREQDALGH